MNNPEPSSGRGEAIRSRALFGILVLMLWSSLQSVEASTDFLEQFHEGRIVKRLLIPRSNLEFHFFVGGICVKTPAPPHLHRNLYSKVATLFSFFSAVSNEHYESSGNGSKATSEYNGQNRVAHDWDVLRGIVVGGLIGWIIVAIVVYISEQVFNRMRLIPGFPGNNRRPCGCSRERVREQPQNLRLFPAQPFFLTSILIGSLVRSGIFASEKRQARSGRCSRAGERSRLGCSQRRPSFF